MIDQGVMTGTIVQDAERMASCISRMASNISDGKPMLEGMEEYPHDEVHGLKNKIYIPYSIYQPGQ